MLIDRLLRSKIASVSFASNGIRTESISPNLHHVVSHIILTIWLKSGFRDPDHYGV